MQVMKNLVGSIVLGSLVFGLAACAKKDKRQRISVGRDARGPSEVNQRGATDQNGQPIKFDPVNGTSWGEITGSPQNLFEEAVRYLVSASIDPKELGSVSGQSGQNTGVRFWGVVETESSFTQGPSRQAIRLNTAELRITIWDSFAGQTDSAGNVIPEYPIHFHGAAEGYVDGTRAVLTFSDSLGKIILDGTISKDYFQGAIRFDNVQYWDGRTPGAEGTIGSFKVPTCGFFKCN